MKHISKYSFLDIVFSMLVGVFVLLSLYEGVRFLSQWYSYPRFITVFLILTALYIWMRFGFTGIKNIISDIFGNRRDGMLHYSELAGARNSHQYVQKHIRPIMYGLTIFVILIIFISMIANTSAVIPFVAILYLSAYGISKFYGFSFQNSIERSFRGESNMFRFLLIVFSIYTIIIAQILRVFEIPSGEHIWYYIIFSLIFGGVFGILLYRIKWPKIFSVYNSLSFLLIASLIMLLAYQNRESWFGSNVQETQTAEFSQNIEENTPQNTDIFTPEDDSEIVIGIISQEAQLEEKTLLISESYDLTPGLALGSQGSQVGELQSALTVLGYYSSEQNNIYDETTRDALIQALRTECDWPESTQGIFGPLAKECLDTLEITIP